jgi:hypothetical protein
MNTRENSYQVARDVMIKHVFYTLGILLVPATLLCMLPSWLEFVHNQYPTLFTLETYLAMNMIIEYLMILILGFAILCLRYARRDFTDGPVPFFQFIQSVFFYWVLVIYIQLERHPWLLAGPIVLSSVLVYPCTFFDYFPVTGKLLRMTNTTIL